MYKYTYIITVCYLIQFIKSQIAIQLTNKYQFKITLNPTSNNSSFLTGLCLEDKQSRFHWVSEHNLKNDPSFNTEYLEPESFITDINNKTYTFPVYYIKSGETCLGLNPSFHNESIIHSIYNKNYISKKAFAIEVYNDNNSNNFLYLGNIPSSKTKYYQRITTPRIEDVKSSNGDEYWGFRIQSLAINKEKLKIDSTIFVAFVHDSFVVNKKIYNWVRDLLLKDFISNGTCIESTGTWVNLKCDRNIADYLPPLQFIISEKPLQVFEVKFIKEGDIALSFTYNEVLDKRPYIFLNKNLFYGKIIQFDYDSNEISFYIPKTHAIYDVVMLMKKMLFINVILLVLSGGYLIFSFFSEKTILVL